MLLANSLTDIANQHGTDKGTVGPSVKWGCHNYTDVYEAYLEKYRLSPIVFLEIGLGVVGARWESQIVHGRNTTGGASLKMWHDYFPNATIYGIDVNSAKHIDNDRIHTYIADQSNVGDLQAFSRAIGDICFDVIVDDGSHRPDHQQISLGHFFTKLKSGGYYFIEDLQTNGLGDHAEHRQSNNSVRNTRRVLRTFKESGVFGEPHALGSADYLAANIEHLAFHTPTHSPNRRMLKSAAMRLLRPNKDYSQNPHLPNSEKLCVIRKK